MRYLVTGGAGFVGSNLVDRLLAEDHEVDVIDDLSHGKLTNLAEARARAQGALKIHHLDVRSRDTVTLMERRAPDIVVHLAAQIDVRVSVNDPVFDAEVNIIGLLNVLEG
ncbi:MAG: UDP-glucose 4-epimerase, partial [Actinomycetota bacterium]